jgi:translation initiation factor IF-2
MQEGAALPAPRGAKGAAWSAPLDATARLCPRLDVSGDRTAVVRRAAERVANEFERAPTGADGTEDGMNDTNDHGEKTLSVERKKTFSLRRPSVEQGTVRQSFSHGRTKAVVVEKKKRRIALPGEPGHVPGQTEEPSAAPEPRAEAPRPVERPAPAAPTPAAVVKPVVAAKPAVAAAAPARPVPAATPARPAAPTARPAAPAPGGRPSGAPQGERPRPADQRGRVVHRTLTQEEIGARAQALAEARLRETEDRKRAEEEARREREELERLRREREEAERRRAEEEVLRQQEAEERRKTELEAGPAAATPAATTPAAAAATPAPATAEVPPPGRRVPLTPDEEAENERKAKALTAVKRPKGAVVAKPAPKTDDRRRTRLTIVKALEGDDGRSRSLAAMRRRVEKQKRAMNTGPREKISREVILPETISIQELANRMAERGVDVIKLLMRQGQMLKITDVIDADTAQLIAEELGHSVKRVSESDVEEGLFSEIADNSDGPPRPPVVTIMGHVDHGKTSLLDAIRNTSVVSGEAGGITQHIGAYQVEKNGSKITFIDTPGHAAFTAMRARGAKATDIVILVVAADDGVKPQTIEAINHARAAHVPIIVAINKIDKPGANPDRVRTDLLQHEIVVESMGGDTLEIEVSALKGTGLDKLLEAILLQTEVLELRADPTVMAEGIVIEAKLDKGRGPVATVLVQRGTLRPGDILIAGAEWGRVRALIDDRGEQVKEAGPSMPVEVLGFQATPEAGDRFAVVENEARAREVADYRQRVRREKASSRPGLRSSLADMMSQLKSTGRKEFTLLVKGDVQGSVEAIVGALDKLGTAEVAARVLLSGVGAITESDVTLANASNAAIIGFNVRANKQARDLAERDGIEIRYYNVIYDLVDDVKAAMSGLLSPERRETFLGNAEVLQVFDVSKVGKVAGCRVTEGTVERGAQVRLIRDGVVIHEGKLSQLKRFKDDAREVVAGQECGMAFEGYQDMRAGDVIECFRVEQVARTL